MIESLAIFFITIIPLLLGFTRFPKLVGDEGIYVSQAWWLVHFGQLGPYTYWYDHFPLGWLMIGMWQKVTGGPFLLGIAEFSGRLFSILVVGLSGVLLYQIGLSLTKSKRVGLLASAIFALSPLSILFHRQILLENLATFWLLLSVWLLTTAKTNKGYLLILSGLTMGLAILTKESLLYLIPAWIVGVTFIQKERQPLIRIFLPTLTLGCVLIAFPLLAGIKGELWSNQEQSISLVRTISHQLNRGNNIPWFQDGSEFRQKIPTWLYLDSLLILVGLGSIGVNLLLHPNNRRLGYIHLLILSFMAFLARGGLVLDYYIIPILPLLALEIAIFLHPVTTKYFALILGGISLYYIVSGQYLYTQNATKNQLQAYQDIVSTAHNDDIIVTDNYFFLNLRFNPNLSPRFFNTQWYTKIDTDTYTAAEIAKQGGKINWLLIDDMMNAEIAQNVYPFLASQKKSMQLQSTYPLPTDDVTQLLYRRLPYALEPTTLYTTPLQDMVKSLSPKQQIGQVIWTSPEGLSLSHAEKNLIEQQYVSGILITKKNVQNSTQLDSLLKEIKRANNTKNPLSIAISFEGGSDTPIPWLSGISNRSLKSASEAVELATSRAKQLTSLGFNIIVGPITSQSFSTQITKTYQKYGLKVVTITQNQDAEFNLSTLTNLENTGTTIVYEPNTEKIIQFLNAVDENNMIVSTSLLEAIQTNSQLRQTLSP